MTLLEAKARLRDRLKRLRNALTDEEIAVNSRRIYERLVEIDAYTGARSAFCYIAYLSEVETRPILDDCLQRGLRLAVPRIVDSTTMHAVPFTGWNDLEPDQMGILTPIRSEPDPGPFDLVIAPGLGFNLQGGRLGYGRGYYDRWFARHQANMRVGICFEIQLVDSLPVEETDFPLDMLITEAGVYNFRG